MAFQKKAQAGGPVSLAASFINDLRRMLSWWKSSSALDSAGQLGALITGTDAPVKNVTGGAVERWKVLQIATAGGVNDQQRFEGDLPDSAETSLIGITQGTAPADGDYVSCRVAGVSFCKINVLSLSHKFARPAVGSTLPVSADSGPLVLLGTPSGTGGQTLLVRIDKGGDSAKLRYIKAPNAGIPRRVGNFLGSAVCTFCDFNPLTGAYTVSSDTGTVFNPISQVVLDKGDHFGRAAFFDGAWHVDVGDCGDGGSGLGSTGILSAGGTLSGTYSAPIPE